MLFFFPRTDQPYLLSPRNATDFAVIMEFCFRVTPVGIIGFFLKLQLVLMSSVIKLLEVRLPQLLVGFVGGAPTPSSVPPAIPNFRGAYSHPH